MLLMDAYKLAESLLDQHGLSQKGWVFRFDNATSRLGVTKYAQKRISLSRWMVEHADVALVHQILLHEIAHALVPSTVKPHGKEWKDKAAEIGYSGGRLSVNPYREKQLRKRR